MAARTPRIFLSYRREESAPHAGRLYDRLCDQFGEQHIFMDVDSIALGVDFVEAITTAVASCEVLIVMIGNGWLRARTSGGSRRIDDRRDFVRLEIETALQRGVRVIPVLLDGAALPGEDDLPASLGALSRRQAITLTHGNFRLQADRLIADIRRMSGGGAAGSALPASSGQVVAEVSDYDSRLALTVRLASTHHISVHLASWRFAKGTIVVDGVTVAKKNTLGGTYNLTIEDAGRRVPARLTVHAQEPYLREIVLMVDGDVVYRGSESSWRPV